MREDERYCLKCKNSILRYTPLNIILKGDIIEYVCYQCKTMYRENIHHPGVLVEKIKELQN